MRRRVCLVAASEMTVRAFLQNQIGAMQQDYDVSVIVGTSNIAFLNELGLSARLIPMAIERNISLRKDIVALLRMIRLFQREQFSLVHSITPKAGLLATLAGFVCRIPVRVHTFTGQVWATRAGWQRGILKNIDRLTAACATQVIVDSASQREFLVHEGVVAASKSIVLRSGSVSGVNGDRFRPDAAVRRKIRGNLSIPPTAKVLLFVGRLTRDKGVLDLAHAFTRVAGVRDDVRLLVVGNDEQNLRSAIQEIAGAHRARLHFVAFTNEPESFMAASDVLCLPSYREGFGSVVIEAAAAGLPAVASRIYGIVDAVQEGRTGLCHPPGDVDAIQHALLRILSDSDLRRILGENARNRALEDFGESAMTAAVLDFYRRRLSSVPAAHSYFGSGAPIETPPHAR